MLDIKEVKHIADLARLELSDQEIHDYRQQLSDILDYFELLNEVDTEDVAPTVQVSQLSNVWREDTVKPWDEAEVKAALSSSELVQGQIKVKKVL